MSKLYKNKLYDEKTISSMYPDIILVYMVGDGDWANYLYFVPSENIYLEKGAFGTHDAICYKVSEVFDEVTANEWKKKSTDWWKKYFPNLI